ncbi:MAG: nicotinate-nucleotide adenylyltransferase [Desulfobacterales bacterium]|jgi:nicotinate-nucleotide adenylyltransferase
MRIGLFGGTFNPIHRGHLRAAAEVKKGFHLDQVFLIPAALPPHKTPGAVANADDRLAMIRLAIEGLSGITVSDVELNRPGPSYTIDTVHYFKQMLADDSRIYLMMGLDAFLEINTWKSHAELLEQIDFIVMARPNEDYPDAQQGWKILENYLKFTLAEDYEFLVTPGCYRSEGKPPIHIVDIDAMDISSTKIRERVKKQKTIEHLVPVKVAEFIQSKGLYK